MEGEKHDHHLMPETRGLYLSEEQTISTSPNVMHVVYVIRFRLLTGSILAHEMMHAWLRLKGYPNPSPEVEDGICQVLAPMWSDSEILAGSGSNVASTSASSSSSSSVPTSTKKAYVDGFRKEIKQCSSMASREPLATLS